jgi:hypothetical protein
MLKIFTNKRNQPLLQHQIDSYTRFVSSYIIKGNYTNLTGNISQIFKSINHENKYFLF